MPLSGVINMHVYSIFTEAGVMTRCVHVWQVPGQCVEGQVFSAAPVYSPGKQPNKHKTCTISTNLSELGEYDKVIIPKRARTSKKTQDGSSQCLYVIWFNILYVF